MWPFLQRNVSLFVLADRDRETRKAISFMINAMQTANNHEYMCMAASAIANSAGGNIPTKRRSRVRSLTLA